MKKYFFDDNITALLYIVFIVLVPFGSVLFQAVTCERAMYVSYLVAGFAMTYDYLILFKQKPSPMLWTEALISAVCFIATLVIAVFKLMATLSRSSQITSPIQYHYDDWICIAVLGIMVLINLFELVRSFLHDYKTRFGSRTGVLSQGAANI